MLNKLIASLIILLFTEFLHAEMMGLSIEGEGNKICFIDVNTDTMKVDTRYSNCHKLRNSKGIPMYCLEDTNKMGNVCKTEQELIDEVYYRKLKLENKRKNIRKQKEDRKKEVISANKRMKHRREFNKKAEDIITHSIKIAYKTPSLLENKNIEIMSEIKPNYITEFNTNVIFGGTGYVLSYEFLGAPIVTFDKQLIKKIINNPQEYKEKNFIFNCTLKIIEVKQNDGSLVDTLVLSVNFMKPRLVESSPNNRIIEENNYRIIKHAAEYEGYTYEIGRSCEVLFSPLKYLMGYRNCQQRTNSKQITIYCTNDMKICKTKDEIVEAINKME